MIFNVMHRNGSTIAFDTEKIMAAVEKALQSSSHNDSFTQEERQNYHRHTADYVDKKSVNHIAHLIFKYR